MASKDNAWQNSALVVARSLMDFKHSIRLLKSFSKELNPAWTGGSGPNGTKTVGDTITVTREPRLWVEDGFEPSVQGVRYRPLTVTIDKQKSVALSATIKEHTFDIDNSRWSKAINRGAKAMASAAERDAGKMYKKVYRTVGDPTREIDSVKVIREAIAKLAYACVPDGTLYFAVPPMMNINFGEAISKLYGPQKLIEASATAAQIPKSAWGYDSLIDTNAIEMHTFGNRPKEGMEVKTTVNKQGASEIVLTKAKPSGLTGNPTIKEGDTFRISGVYEVVPEFHTVTPNLAGFVATEDATSTTTDITVKVAPEMYSLDATELPEKAIATINRLPKAGDLVTMDGEKNTTTEVAMMYHGSCFGFCQVPLEPSVSFPSAWYTQDDMGMLIETRIPTGGSSEVTYLRTIYTIANLLPEFAVRVYGK